MSRWSSILVLVLFLGAAACQPPQRQPAPPPKPQLPILTPDRLGMSAPIPLDVLFVANPPESSDVFGGEQAYRALTSSILGSAFTRSLPAGREDWLAVQRLRAGGERMRMPEIFRFPSLLVTELDLAEGAARLRLRLFDLSCTDYRDLDGTFVPSTWERALVFEETRELSATASDSTDAWGWSLIDAWQAALTDLRVSRRFQSYRERLERGALATESNGAALLGVLSPQADIVESTGLLFADGVSDLWSPSEQKAVLPPAAIPKPPLPTEVEDVPTPGEGDAPTPEPDSPEVEDGGKPSSTEGSEEGASGSNR